MNDGRCFNKKKEKEEYQFCSDNLSSLNNLLKMLFIFYYIILKKTLTINHINYSIL